VAAIVQGIGNRSKITLKKMSGASAVESLLKDNSRARSINPVLRMCIIDLMNLSGRQG